MYGASIDVSKAFDTPRRQMSILADHDRFKISGNLLRAHDSMRRSMMRIRLGCVFSPPYWKDIGSGGQGTANAPGGWARGYNCVIEANELAVLADERFAGLTDLPAGDNRGRGTQQNGSVASPIRRKVQMSGIDRKASASEHGTPSPGAQYKEAGSVRGRSAAPHS